MTQLELWLDSYSDIYSDFDSRLYSKRRISEDFIRELKYGLAHNEGFITDLIFLLPEEQRNHASEPLIIESLYAFFNGKQYSLEKLVRKKKWSAWVLLLGGMVLMWMDALIAGRLAPSVTAQFLRVLLQPAGWFFLWTAMQTLFYDLRQHSAERKFYTELAGVKCHFRSTAD